MSNTLNSVQILPIITVLVKFVLITTFNKRFKLIEDKEGRYYSII